ncbi:MAG: radical SAM family heme chaperone HemW [Gammaproteobacteria bacterium]|nr:radical SAM family heme chaperone HemW [Gammaproteobacteria bacterium]
MNTAHETPAVAHVLPLALYVHLPWCVSKCPYCDFNSHSLRGELPEQAYIKALLEDAAVDAAWVTGRAIETVFLGGGTPSLFSAGAIGDLLDGLAACLPLRKDSEITLEVNPGTVERGRLADYRRAGVNRLSLGAQSFDAAQLRTLGRIHGPAEIFAAVDEAVAGGFDNFNLDLMYALPRQSVAQACADVRAALSLGPAHLSHYQLTLEPNTRFHHAPPPLPDEDLICDIEQATRALLRESGFTRYEVSAWSRPGRECRHNLNYWRFGDYLGLGAGAHGKQTTPQGVRRTRRVAHPRAYLEAPAARRVQASWPGPADRQFEFLLNALRLREGFSEQALEQATGTSPLKLLETMAQARDQGLLEKCDGRWRATELGYVQLDGVLAAFLPDAE